MSDKKRIEKLEPGWSKAVVMVCSKCGKQFDDANLQESPERIKTELKSESKDKLGKTVRVVNSGCLNICPENKIAIAIASKDEKEVFRAYSVPADASGEEVFEEIFK